MTTGPVLVQPNDMTITVGELWVVQFRFFRNAMLWCGQHFTDQNDSLAADPGGVYFFGDISQRPTYRLFVLPTGTADDRRRGLKGEHPTGEQIRHNLFDHPDRKQSPP